MPQNAVPMGEVEEAGALNLEEEGESQTLVEERENLHRTGDTDWVSPGEPKAD